MWALSLVASSRDYSLLAVFRLPIVAAAFVAQALGHLGFSFAACDSVVAISRLQITGSAIVAHGLVALRHMGLSEIRNGTCLLRLQVDSLLLNHQRSPENVDFKQTNKNLLCNIVSEQ